MVVVFSDRFLADRFVEGTCPFCNYEVGLSLVLQLFHMKSLVANVSFKFRVTGKRLFGFKCVEGNCEDGCYHNPCLCFTKINLNGVSNDIRGVFITLILHVTSRRP